MPPEPEADLSSHPAVRGYSLVCLVALLALTLFVTERGMGWWGLMPVFLGAAAVLFRWGVGPPLVLVTLAILLAAQARFRLTESARPSLLADLGVCLAVLAYTAAQYRLLGLTRHVLPPDTRRRTLPGQGKAAAAEGPRRSPGSVGPWELPGLLLTLLMWAVVAAFAWARLQLQEPMEGLPEVVWRVILLAWVFAVGLAVTAAGLSYLGMAQAGRAVARVFLQDQVWRETRPDQARLNRWLVWARLRRQRKEGA
ncbi:MAG TPA: hypothetical protein VFE78_08360 [Gemmataceae bacterium]|nr:hypothetical protein [Gemmataceae bacterium]